MNAGIFAFGWGYQQGESATHPLARLNARLPLSLIVAGMSLLPPRFVPGTRPDVPSGASNCGF